MHVSIIALQGNFARRLVIAIALVLANAAIGFSCDVTITTQDNIQAKVNAYGPGTTFCFQPGTYRITTPILPQSDDVFIGNYATLKGAKLVTTFSPSGSRWVARDVVQPNPVRLGDCLPASYTGCTYAEAVFVNNQQLWRVMSLSEVTTGKFYIDYSRNDLYIGDYPYGQNVELAVATRAFRGSGTGVENVTVRGFFIEKFANEAGVGAIDARNTWTIYDNNIYQNHGTGISGGAVILENYVHHNGYSGVMLYKAVGSLVQSNEIYANNTAGFNWDGTFSGAGGSKFGATTNLIVRGNYVHDNLGMGLWTDGDNFNTLYEWNYTRNNYDAGILHEVSYDAVIRNNTSVNDGVDPIGYTSMWWGSGIMVNDSRNVEVVGNTVINGMNGIGVVDSDRGYLDPYGRPYRIENLKVHHNLIIQSTGTAAGIVSDDPRVFTDWNNQFWDNVYHLGNLNGKYFQWHGERTRTEWTSYGHDLNGTFTLVPQ